MGRQIEYYMELESYKSLVKKAYDLGFKMIIEEQNNFKMYSCFEELPFTKHRMYFYLEEAGQLIIKENGYVDSICSPVIESGYSHIDENKKEISKSRIWVSTGFWDGNEDFIHRNEVLDNKYSSLVRHVKKIAPITEVEVKARNPIYEGKKFKKKVYITPFILKKIESGEYDCI